MGRAGKTVKEKKCAGEQRSLTATSPKESAMQLYTPARRQRKKAGKVLLSVPSKELRSEALPGVQVGFGKTAKLLEP